MNIRRKIRKIATPYLHADETIVAVFVAEFPRGFDPSFWIASTSQRILVFEVSGWRNQIIKFDGTLPRSTKFGPVHGLTFSVPALGGRWIGRGFFDVVTASDATSAGTSSISDD